MSHSHWQRGSAEKQQPFDFRATRDNVAWAIEVKHYRTERAQPALLQAAALQLLNALARQGLSKGMLIASCTLYPELRENLENKFGIVFVDRSDLFIWGAKDPEVATRLASFLE